MKPIYSLNKIEPVSVLLVFATFYFLVEVIKSKEGGVESFIVMSILSICWLAYSNGCMVSVKNKKVMVKKFIFFSRFIDLSDVAGWKNVVGMKKFSDGFKATFRLEIYSKSRNKPLIIPVKIFKARDIQQLTEFLRANCDNKSCT